MSPTNGIFLPGRDGTGIMDTLSGVKCLKFVGVLPQPSPHKGHQALYRAEGHPAKSAMPGWQAALPLHLCDIDKGSEGEYVGHFSKLSDVLHFCAKTIFLVIHCGKHKIAAALKGRLIKF